MKNWTALLYSHNDNPFWMQDRGLIAKLFVAGVIDKRIDELKFSDEFCKHLIEYNRNRGLKGTGSIEAWREILTEFSGSLARMSDKEVATTIVLLDYFLDKQTSEKR